MEKILSVHNVSKAYPGEKLGAVNAVSFDMEASEVLAVVGASGSGKSTLLRMLAGLLKPDSGEIVFQGKPLDNPNEQLIAGNPAIKMVFQNFDLMPNMTVAENLKYPLLAYNKEYIEARVIELLDLCNIAELAAKFPKELSGGQQQRVALARALADEPELLLMDEPFSQLDPVNKSQLLREVLSIIKASGVGLVFVTHDTRDALMIADRIAFLKSGRLEQEGKPQVLYRQPASLEIARFFGPVNIFGPNEIEEYLPQLVSDLSEHNTKAIGIRAEDLSEADEISDVILNLSVSKVFFLGDHYLAECLLAGGEAVIIKVKSTLLKPGNEISVAVSKEKLLYFYMPAVS